ncbi:MAG: calcium-binding protein [Planctomycetota bacterium]
MMSNRTCIVRVLALAWASSTGGVLLAQATTRVSVDSQGGEGNDLSEAPAVSADGRFVAFASVASDLVPGDTNGWEDVFVHDRQTGATTRVSVDTQGGQGNNPSFNPAVSADGRFVAFASVASNLVPGDTNDSCDVFVHDRQTGVTTRVSVDSQGGQSGGALLDAPAVSADGRLVAFTSGASDLVPGDTNQKRDVFVHDRQTGETTRVSVDSQGGQGYDDSRFASISADGRLVAFSSGADNFVPGDTNYEWDVFVQDRETGETTRMSVDSQGGQANANSAPGAISADGRFVTFWSYASNLVPGDTNGLGDVFVHDRETGETTRVNVDSQGRQTSGAYWGTPAISADGRFVAFAADAGELVPGDTNEVPDVFVRDRQMGETTRASVDSRGGQGNDRSWKPAISADGELVAFSSDASNLVRNDSNERSDIFVHDRAPGPCSLPASWTNYGSGWPGTNGVPGLVARSNPVLCAPLEVFADNSSGVATTVVFLAGDHSVHRWTPWGGTVLVLPALAVSLQAPADGLSITSTIPCDGALCGMSVFAQVLELDPGASRGISFTPGLELRLGGP